MTYKIFNISAGCYTNHGVYSLERRNITLILYLHLSFWVETHQDAVRLCEMENV